MTKSGDIEAKIATIFNATWDSRDGQVVPATKDVALANGVVKMEAVLLYADLFHSTEMVRTLPNGVAAKIIRAYLSSMTRLINDAGGVVRSFDGDRVMGVFVGGSKNTDAARCALKMNYVVRKILKPKAEEQFPSVKKTGFDIAHCAGISKSHVWIVRGGVRGANDLVFVGSAPNIAAKLSDIRDTPWHTYITWDVYNYLKDTAKFGGDDKRNMWVSTHIDIGSERWHCYASKFWWEP